MIDYSSPICMKHSPKVKIRYVGKLDNGDIVIQQWEPWSRQRDWRPDPSHWGFPEVIGEEDLENIPEQEL